jgi:hypothetical protein
MAAHERSRGLPRFAAAASGSRPSTYALVRECMAQYISPILVDSVLRRALHAAGTTPSAPGTMQKVVEESMIGLRLFVDPHRLPHLMLELADILAKED